MAKKISLIVTQSVTVVRDGKRLSPPLGKAYDFTEDEARLVLKANPQGLRKPINETAEPDSVLEDDEPDADDEAVDIDDMTVPQLKAYLDENGIEYNADDKKADLVKLAKGEDEDEDEDADI